MDPIVQALIDEPDNPRVYLVKFMLRIASSTAVEPRGFSFTQNHDDPTPPVVDGLIYRSLLLEALAIGGALDRSTLGIGRSVEPEGGNIVIANGNGEVDTALLGYDWQGVDVMVRLGPPGGTVESDYGLLFAGKVDDIEWTDEQVEVILRDRSLLLDRRVTDGEYGGTGGLDGDADAAGKLHVMTFGEVFNLPPVLIDGANVVYQFARNSVLDVQGAFDAGKSLDLSETASVDFGTVPPGSAVWERDTARVRLGAPPEGALTIDARGDASTAYFDNAAELIRYIAINYAGIDTADIDHDAFDQIATLTAGARVGWYGNDTFINIFNELAGSIGCWWGWTRPGLLTIGRVEIGTPTELITQNQIIDGTFQRQRVDPHVWRYRLGYRKPWLVQPESDVSPLANANRRQNVSGEHSFVSVQALQVKGFNPIAREIEAPSLLRFPGPARTEAQRRLDLLSAPRDIYQVDLRRSLWRYSIGQTVTLFYPRFRLQGGKSMLVLALEESAAEDVVTATLWG